MRAKLTIKHTAVAFAAYSVNYWYNECQTRREYNDGVDPQARYRDAKRYHEELKENWDNMELSDIKMLSQVLMSVMIQSYLQARDYCENKYIVVDRLRQCIEARWELNKLNDEHFKLYSTKYLIKTNSLVKI